MSALIKCQKTLIEPSTSAHRKHTKVVVRYSHWIDLRIGLARLRERGFWRAAE